MTNRSCVAFVAVLAWLAAAADAQNAALTIAAVDNPEMVRLQELSGESTGRRFDPDWRPALDTEAWSDALGDHVALLTKHGPPGAVSVGYDETHDLFASGQCGIRIDATVAATTLPNPDRSEVADKVGHAMAPGTGEGPVSS